MPGAHIRRAERRVADDALAAILAVAGVNRDAMRALIVTWLNGEVLHFQVVDTSER